MGLMSPALGARLARAERTAWDVEVRPYAERLARKFGGDPATIAHELRVNAVRLGLKYGPRPSREDMARELAERTGVSPDEAARELDRIRAEHSGVIADDYA
jgi:hypothetical protein